MKNKSAVQFDTDSRDNNAAQNQATRADCCADRPGCCEDKAACCTAPADAAGAVTTKDRPAACACSE